MPYIVRPFVQLALSYLLLSGSSLDHRRTFLFLLLESLYMTPIHVKLELCSLTLIQGMWVNYYYSRSTG